LLIWDALILSKDLPKLSISRTIQELGLTQNEATAALGIDQPSISRLLKGQLRGFKKNIF
jgi:predicted XRE-type DNA-binding protein